MCRFLSCSILKTKEVKAERLSFTRTSQSIKYTLQTLSLCTLPADLVFVYTSCRSRLYVHFLQILSLCTLPADLIFVTAADTQFTSRDFKPNKRRRERTQTRKLYSPKIVVKVRLGLTTGPTN